MEAVRPGPLGLRPCPTILIKIDPAALIKNNAFGLKPHLLLLHTFARPRRDFALRVDHALPRHIVGAHRHRVTDDAGIAARPDDHCHIAVGCHFTTRHLAHDLVDAGKQCASLRIDLHDKDYTRPSNWMQTPRQ